MYPWPDGGSSSEGVPEDCGPSCCLQGATRESRRHFLSALCVCLRPFPFPSPSHSSSPLESVTGPVSPATALVASPSLTACTFLCQKGGCWRAGQPASFSAVAACLAAGSIRCVGQSTYFRTEERISWASWYTGLFLSPFPLTP